MVRAVPTFCRHNRFVQNCPICREPEPATPPRARRAGGSPARAGAGQRRPRERAGGAGRGRAPDSARGRRRLRSALVPGLRASADAERLADEVAFAAGRLALLAADPPGLYAEVAAEPDPEEARAGSRS